MALRGLIFDVDGTMAETEEMHRGAFNDAFAAQGLDWLWDKAMYSSLINSGSGPERMRAFVSRYRPNDLQRLEEEGTFDTLYRLKSDLLGQAIERGGAPFRPGVARLISEARMYGVRLAICSSSTRLSFELLMLTRFGFESIDWFHSVVSYENGLPPKPQSAVYDAALADLRLNPDEVMAIEDSQAGVQAATSAGVMTVATPSLYHMDEDFSAAQIVLADLGEPHSPCDVIRGDAMGEDCVSLSTLSHWLDPAAAAA